MAASITSAINTGAALVAAPDAVWFARTTALEADAGRRERHDAHQEEMRELRADRQAAADRHNAEMRERGAVFQADLALRRLAELEAISTLMLHMVEVACEEYHRPPQPVDPTQGLGQSVTTTRVRAIRLRLDTAVEAYLSRRGCQ